MRYVDYTTRFERDAKRMQKRGKDLKKLTAIIHQLKNDEVFPISYRDHALSGKLLGYRDIHIEPDWVLVYQKTGDTLLLLAMTGTHSDLFD